MSRDRSIGFGCAVFLLAGSPADAAVRICLAEVSSGLQAAAQEPDARRLAIESWTSNATAAGAVHPIWRTAIGRHLACSKGEDGRFQCLAKAGPCFITHKLPPPGTYEPWKPKGIGG